jgi:DNA-binding transcriptional MerR regulator
MGFSALHTLLTPAAATALDVHPETLRRYVKEGKLVARKVRRRWRFSPRDVAIFKRFGPPSGRVCDVARALGVHRNTVLAWEAKGKIQSFDRTVGGRRFRREDVVGLARQISKGCGKNVGEVCAFCGRSVGAGGSPIER